MNDFYGVRPNEEAERSVIGAMLIDSDNIIPETETILSQDDFLVTEYRTIFKTCSCHFIEGKPVDAVTVSASLGDEYKPVIAECIQSMPSIQNWKSYAELVQDTARRRRAWESAEILMENLTCESADICQQMAVRTCEHLASKTSGNSVSSKEGFVKFYSSLQKPVSYIRTGFSKIDKYTHIQPGDLVVIGARPSVGKTAITLQMMMHMSKSRKVAYFSLETRNNNLFGRMAANLSGINLSDIKSRQDIDYERLADTGKLFDMLNFHTIEAAGWSVPQIKAKAIQLGAEVIFVDYIGLLSSEGKGRYEKITNISVDLHTLAQQSNITVFALSQLSREGKGEPTLECLRESGQIEQDADAVMLLWAQDGLESKTREMIIAKNKEGQVGKVTLSFEGEKQRFFEIDTRYGS